jgi:acetyltransferase-like isoleucine patch superfamily enzyme
MMGRKDPLLLKNDPRYSKYTVGDWSYGAPDIVYWDAGAALTIGRFCQFARNSTIFLGGEHHVDWVTTYPFPLIMKSAAHLSGYPYSKGDVHIGHDVWVGEGALILSGITIGNGAVIASRSIVTKDVAPFSIMAGNPARAIRSRFPEHLIGALEEIAWWNWPLPKIQQALPLLLSSDIQQFVDTYAVDVRQGHAGGAAGSVSD